MSVPAFSAFAESSSVAGRAALAEWQTTEIPKARLSEADRRLAKQLSERSSSAAVFVDELRSSVRVRATGAVGVLKFDEFQLEIRPKLAGGNVGLFRLIEAVSGFEQLALFKGVPELDASGASLLDLVVHALNRATSDVILQGLRSDYVVRQGALAAVRGRMLPDRQLLDRLGVNDRIVCRFNEFEQDVPDNQLLALALDLGVRQARHPVVKARAGALASLLQQVCDPTPLTHQSTNSLASMLVYDRMNGHYRAAHRLALLLLASLGPSDDLAAGNARFDSFLIDMNRLFERLVEMSVRRALGTSWQVQDQAKRLAFTRQDDGSSYGTIRPDLVATSGTSRVLPIDSKYKNYGKDRRIAAGDLAQILLYALTLAPPSGRAARAALVFPLDRQSLPSTTTIDSRIPTLDQARPSLLSIGIHIPSVVDELSQPGPGPHLRALGDAMRGHVSA